MVIDECYQNHKGCCLKTEHLQFIADCASRDWRNILRNLQVEEHVIETVTDDAEYRMYNDDSREIAYQAFLRWMRLEPTKASICVLSGALERAGRNDLNVMLRNTFGFNVDLFISAAHEAESSYPAQYVQRHFVGRKQEKEQIVQFCDFQSTSRLLLIAGLPGLGITDLLDFSLQVVHEKIPNMFIVRPLIPSNCAETQWGLKDIAVGIMEILQPSNSLPKHRVAMLQKTLVGIKSPTLLVLEIANLNFKPDADITFWNFIDRLLCYKNNNLKVIITSCKTTRMDITSAAEVEQLELKELSLEDTTKLLQKTSPQLNERDCGKLYHCCGGNPFILRKFGAHIQNFNDHEKEMKELFRELETSSGVELQTFLRQTALQRDMRIVFNDLEQDEQETLIKLCCFHSIIPIETLEYLFGKDVALIANHLWRSHCILDKGPSGNHFRMNELTRTFIINHAKSNLNLRNIFDKAKVTLISYHLKLLQELDDLYICPQNLHYSEICCPAVEKYRKECKNCKRECQCALSQILQVIFQKDKTALMRSIKHGILIGDTFDDVVDTCLRAVLFLRNVISSFNLHELYDLIFTKLKEIDDKIRMAIAMANLVFIKINQRFCDEQKQNIVHLSKSIKFLEMNKDQLSVHYLESLAYCYVIRGYLQGFYKHQFKKGMDDLRNARWLLSNIPSSPRLNVAELSTYGYMGAIYYMNGMLQESNVVREIQIDGYKQYLGIHPYSAKCLYYLSKGYCNLKMYGKAEKYCLLSYQMYLTLKGEGLDTMKVLSTYGEILIDQGHIDQGIGKLKQALEHGEKVLGEHDKIAWRYNQLADAKEKANAPHAEVQILRDKATEMKEKYKENTTIHNRKTYSLQLSHSEFVEFSSHATNFKENDKPVPYTHFFISIVILIVLVIIDILLRIYPPGCCPD